jgi:N-ethylmaleimide reductase
MSPTLFSSIELSPSLALKNRIVMAPMTRARAGESRIPNALMAEYYTQRASAGLIISEATSISEQGIGWLNTPGIYTPEQVEGWKKVTQAVHQAGGKIFLQLWHCGRASHSLFQKDHQLPVSASALAIQNDQIHTHEGKKPYEVPRALETSELKGIVADYARGAKLAKEAGFDGVEIHGANGYLLDQFLQSCSNQRTDAYGGSIENRSRLLLEVVEAVCKEWPEGHVAIRLSPNGRYNSMGSPDYRETFLYAAEQLNKFKLAYLHIMDGIGFGAPESGEPMTLKEFRSVYNGILMGNVDYTQEKAESAINSGDSDLIAFGRPYIVNPDLVERFQNGWPLDTTVDMSKWYSFEAEGYTTYPMYQAHQTPQPV